MSNDLLQEGAEEAPTGSSMPHPESHDITAKSPCHRAVKRQATERSTSPSLVAVLPDELLLKVLRSILYLPSVILVRNYTLTQFVNACKVASLRCIASDDHL